MQWDRFGFMVPDLKISVSEILFVYILILESGISSMDIINYIMEWT